jgi:hypothetical protein
MQINRCLTIHGRPLDQAAAWVQVFGEKSLALEIEKISILTAQLCAEAQILFDMTNAAKD